MRALVFVPAFNEEDCIQAVIYDIRNEFKEKVDILVIDDGSKDRTRQKAKAAGAEVISFPFNQGSGSASQTGYLFAEQNNYNYAAQMDADGQHRAKDLRMILEKVKTNQTDLAVGSRYLNPDKEDKETYSPSFLRDLGSKIFRKTLSISTGTKLTDVTSGMRACNKEIIQQFAEVYDPDYAEIESLQRCLNLGFRVKEYQVKMLPRQAGESKIKTIDSINYALKTFLILAVGSLRKQRDKKTFLKNNQNKGDKK